MPSHDSYNDPHFDFEADQSNVRPSVVAYSARDGRVIIYDKRHRTAWISSTCAVPLQNTS
ncbi:hypothetical protein [Halostagnicola sp. A-GB9-2]|uniref:DUF7331 family protein n=1 Tax=Halostagnicola sp. A-GB9-2 TaxID=3048066 RepID=UPI0024C0DBEA|nr:hypothetical protein [Halostagnicola sp. A-GB9-2]MDJ1433181.1 hypothetical protein [Halostagnicola sp. A-GB9-2]